MSANFAANFGTNFPANFVCFLACFFWSFVARQGSTNFYVVDHFRYYRKNSPEILSEIPWVVRGVFWGRVGPAAQTLKSGESVSPLKARGTRGTMKVGGVQYLSVAD